jgi:4-amino-4-deoxy-L-arabinose transferase-like glycosyltransferase
MASGGRRLTRRSSGKRAAKRPAAAAADVAVEAVAAPLEASAANAGAAPRATVGWQRWMGWQAVLAFALLVRLAYLLTARGVGFEHPILDADYYDFLGARLASGAGFPDEPFWQPPLYPWLLGRLYAIFGHTLWAPRLIQAALGAATAALSCQVAARLSGKRWAGALAGGLVALHGSLVFYDGELLPTSLAALCGAVVLWLATRHPHNDRTAAGLGLAIGLGALCVAPLLLLLAPAAWAMSSGRFRRPLVCALAAALVVAPVTIHNRVRSGEWILISANGGVNLWIGNNPRSDHTTAVRPGAEWEALVEEPELLGIHSAGAQSDFFRKKATDWCISSPIACAKNLAHKARLLLVARDLPRNEDLYVAREQAPVLAGLTSRVGSFALPYALLWPLAVGGAALAIRRRRRDELVAVAVALALAAPCILFFVTGRYRAPLAPALCVLAAMFVVEAAARRLELSSAPVVAALCAFVVGVWPVSLAVDRVDFRAELHYVAGGRLARLGDEEGAARVLYRALEIRPDYLEAGVNLGLMLDRLGRHGEAVEVFDRVLAAHPTSIDATLARASALVRAGRPTEAERALVTLSRRVPVAPDLWMSLVRVATERGDAAAAALFQERAERAAGTSRPAPSVDPNAR